MHVLHGSEYTSALSKLKVTRILQSDPDYRTTSPADANCRAILIGPLTIYSDEWTEAVSQPWRNQRTVWHQGS